MNFGNYIVRFSRILVVILAYLFSSNAWSIRRTKEGQPRLCSLVAASLNGLTRTVQVVGLLPDQTKIQKEILVRAKSNRHVLQGKFQKISLQFNSSSNNDNALLVVQGNDLNLGKTPLLVVSFLPLLAFLFRIRLIRLILLFTILFPVRTGLRLSKDFPDMKSLMGGAPCHFDYVLKLDDKRLSDSFLLKILAKSLLNTFMANSVLPIAAVAGDTAIEFLKEENNASTEMRPNASTDIVAIWNNEKSKEESPSFQLSKLLSATSFQLRATPTFQANGYIVLPCIAMLPPEGTQKESSRLDFTLRTRMLPKKKNLWFPSGTSLSRLDMTGIRFVSPDVRLDVDAAIPNRSPIEWTKQLLPSFLWLPIGSTDLILPLGKRHDMERISISEDSCEISGRVSFFQPKGEEGLNKRLGPSSSRLSSLLGKYKSTKRQPLKLPGNSTKK